MGYRRILALTNLNSACSVNPTTLRNTTLSCIDANGMDVIKSSSSPPVRDRVPVMRYISVDSPES